MVAPTKRGLIEARSAKRFGAGGVGSINELRHRNLTPAHELGHCEGYAHSERGEDPAR